MIQKTQRTAELTPLPSYTPKAKPLPSRRAYRDSRKTPLFSPRFREEVPPPVSTPVASVQGWCLLPPRNPEKYRFPPIVYL
jgi:hypothetical protein